MKWTFRRTHAALQTSRSRRLLALAAALIIGVPGLIAHSEAPAAAVTQARTGKIEIDAPNPVAYIDLTAGFRQQFNSRPFGGNAFYSSGTRVEAFPVVVDLGVSPAGRELTLPTAGTQTFGGSGSVRDPFWVETTAPFSTAGYQTMSITQRLTYIVGTEHVRNDITISNNTAGTKKMQFGQYADCMFTGKDTGTSNIVPDQMVQCLQGTDAMSLIQISPGAAYAGGHYSSVLNAMKKPLAGTASADICWAGSNVPGACATNLDNGFGMAWAVDIEPGAAATRTAYLSYTGDLRFVDLQVDAAISTDQAMVGDDLSYTLSVSNHGRQSAPNVGVAFALPEGIGFAYASGDGDYDADQGVWNAPDLGSGETANITLSVTALGVGDQTARISATSSDGIDPSPCQESDSCGPAMTVHVRSTGVASASAIEASPSEATANGSEEVTITVTAMRPEGDQIPQGGALVELSTTNGEIGVVTDHGDGTYSATMTSTRSGPAVVSMVMNGEPGAATAAAEFVAGPVDLANAGSAYLVSEGEKVAGSGAHTITVTLADAFGNSVPGQVEALAAVALDSLGTGVIGEFVEQDIQGTYAASVSSTRAGAKRIGVEFGGEAVSLGGNETATFVASSVDPGHLDTGFEVSAGAERVGSGTHLVTVTLADEFGNPVAGQAESLTAASSDQLGEGTFGAFVEAEIAGTYTASVSSTLSGAKGIIAEFGGAPLASRGNDAAIFESGSPDPTHANSVFSVSPGDAVVGSGSHEIEVTLVDEYGNLVSGQAAALNAQTTAALGAGVITGFAETGDPGNYAATVSSTLAGEKPVVVALGDDPLEAAGNHIARFVAGAVSTADPATGFQVTEGELVVGTDPHVITVTLVDEYGNPVPGQASELRAEAEGGLGDGEASPFVEAETSGTYLASIASTVSGAKIIQVDVAGDAVAAVGNSDAVFVAGAADLTRAETTYTVSLGDETAGEGAHEVLVTLTDEYGNPVRGQSEQLIAATLDDIGDGQIGGFADDEAAGAYRAQITSTVSGSKLIDVVLGSEPVQSGGNDSAVFVAGPADLSHSDSRYSVTEGGEAVEAGSHTVTVTLADKFGNLVPAAAARLRAATAAELGAGALGEFVETDTIGSYTAAVTSTVAGAKVIGVALENAAVSLAGNPAALFVAGPADLTHEQSRFEVSAGNGTVGSGSHTVTASLVDRFGNAVVEQAALLSAATADSLGEGVITGFVESQDAGTYFASLSSTIAGAKALAVLFGDDPVTAGANEFAVFIAGAIDPTHPDSLFDVTGGEATAGEQTHSVTVRVADRYGNPVSGAATALRAATPDSLGEGGITALVESDTPGTYVARISSTIDGAKIIGVETGGVALRVGGNNDSATFVPGAVDPSHEQTTFEVSTGEELVGSGAHTVTIRLVDRFGNPVPGQESVLAVGTGDSLGAGEISTPRETETPGRYVVTVTSTSSGMKSFAVEHEDRSIAAVDADSVRFIAGPPELGQPETAFEVSGGEATVAEGTHTVSVTLVDQYGNPSSGWSAGLSAVSIDPLGGGLITGFVETAEAGRYMATISSTLAGGKRIATTYDSLPVSIAGNDTARFVAGGASLGSEQTRFRVSEGEQVVGIGAHTVSVRLVDEHGNAVSGQADGLQRSTTADIGDGVFEQFGETSTPGEYEATVSSTRAGAKQIQVAFGGDRVASEGNRVAVFVSGAVDPDRATISAPERIMADGIDTAVVTVTLSDSFNNPIHLTTDVEIRTSLGTLSAVANLGGGKYSAQLSSTTAGVATLGAAVDSALVPATVDVLLLKQDSGPPPVKPATPAPTNGAALPNTGGPLWMLGVAALGVFLLGTGIWLSGGARRRAQR